MSAIYFNDQPETWDLAHDPTTGRRYACGICGAECDWENGQLVGQCEHDPESEPSEIESPGADDTRIGKSEGLVECQSSNQG